MPFKKIGTLGGGPILRTEDLDISIDYEVGDALEAEGGSLILGTAGNLLFGQLSGIVTVDGVAPSSNGNSGDFTMWFKTAATQATDLYQGIADISKNTLYSVDPDATVGTTVRSDTLGAHTDLISEDYTDESSAVLGTAQYHIWGTDPLDSGNQVVNIKESDVFGGA